MLANRLLVRGGEVYLVELEVLLMVPLMCYHTLAEVRLHGELCEDPVETEWEGPSWMTMLVQLSIVS